MGFDEKERSNHGSQVVSLYEFSVGSVQSDGTLLYGKVAWRYASCDSDIEYPENSGKIYVSTPADDSGAAITDDSVNDGFVITLPASSEIAQLFAGDPPSSLIRVTVRRKDLSDPEAPIYWTGFITSAKRTDDVTTAITCADLTADISSSSSRNYWSRTCTHALYDLQCAVNAAQYAQKITVTSVQGNTVVFAEGNNFENGYFAGGYVEWERMPGVLDRRGISQHNRKTLILLGTVQAVKVGDTLTAYPGCDRTKGSKGCAKFANLSNFGGFDKMPGRSPFDGNPVFY